MALLGSVLFAFAFTFLDEFTSLLALSLKAPSPQVGEQSPAVNCWHWSLCFLNSFLKSGLLSFCTQAWPWRFHTNCHLVWPAARPNRTKPGWESVSLGRMTLGLGSQAGNLGWKSVRLFTSSPGLSKPCGMRRQTPGISLTPSQAVGSLCPSLTWFATERTEGTSDQQLFSVFPQGDQGQSVGGIYMHCTRFRREDGPMPGYYPSRLCHQKCVLNPNRAILKQQLLWMTVNYKFFCSFLRWANGFYSLHLSMTLWTKSLHKSPNYKSVKRQTSICMSVFCNLENMFSWKIVALVKFSGELTEVN